jgi:hypothetical protein
VKGRKNEKKGRDEIREEGIVIEWLKMGWYKIG